MSLSVAGAEALSAGLGFGASVFGSTASGLFGANQAAKNRKFQEKMYNRQVQDSIDFWQRQMDYNHPSAQLERIRSAGMNPLLLYGEGGLSGNIAQQSPDLPSAPHGAQGQAQIATRLDMANIALLEAQAKNIEKDTELKGQDIQESKSREANFEYDVMFKRLSTDLDLAIKHGQIGQMDAIVRDYNSQIFNRDWISRHQVLNMIQDREYQIKRFNWDVEYQGTLMLQGWKQLAIGEMNADAALRQAAAAMIHAQNAAKVGNAQIALFAQEYAFNEKNNPLRLRMTGFEVMAKRAGWKLNEAQVFEREFKNKMLDVYGTEQMPSYYTTGVGFAKQIGKGLSNIMDPRWWTTPLGTYDSRKKR